MIRQFTGEATRANNPVTAQHSTTAQDRPTGRRRLWCGPPPATTVPAAATAPVVVNRTTAAVPSKSS